MTTSRLILSNNNNEPHTKHTILAKLDSDLSDAERKSYLNILLQSPETIHLLMIVELEWEKRLIDKEMIIEAHKYYLDLLPMHNSIEESIPDADNILSSMPEAILSLQNALSDYKNCAERLKKSFLFCKSQLDEAKREYADTPRLTR